MSRPDQQLYSSPIYLVGPTASGKSSLALSLAHHLNGEIINADAFQLYHGIPICTAQPTEAEKAVVPHHLYGVLPLSETCDASRYADMAKAAISEILNRGKLPIIVGGSGLYIKALTHGLSDLPSSADLRLELAKLSPEQRVEQLLSLDPDAALTVNLKNDRYVSRALEICVLTGQPQSALRKAWTDAQPVFNGIVLEWPRDVLSDRILLRTRSMIDSGLLDEIRGLPDSLSITAKKAIGINEIQQYLAGSLTLDQTIEAIHFATRQYARRQRKWFRRETTFKSLAMSEELSSLQAVEMAISLFAIHS